MYIIDVGHVLLQYRIANVHVHVHVCKMHVYFLVRGEHGTSLCKILLHCTYMS